MSSLPAPLPVLLGELPLLVRLELTRLLQAQPAYRIVGSAASADELIIMARQLRPALIILGEQHLLSLDWLHRQHPCPVLLYTTSTPLPATLRDVAQWGVYSSVGPLRPAGEEEFRLAVLNRLWAAPRTPGAAACVAPIRHIVSAPPSSLVVVGGSTGGTLAVERLVRGLHPTLSCAVLIAVHMPAHFTASFVKRLRRITSLPVVAGSAGMAVEAGQIIVAPGGQNMVVQPAKRGPWRLWQIGFSNELDAGTDEPSVDLLMRSAATVAGRRTLGVVLTGLGYDGTWGARCIREQGGRVLAQDEESAAVFSMPGSVIRAGYASAVLTPEQMADAINQSVAQPASALPSVTALS